VPAPSCYFESADEIKNKFSKTRLNTSHRYKKMHEYKNPENEYQYQSKMIVSQLVVKMIFSGKSQIYSS